MYGGVTVAAIIHASSTSHSNKLSQFVAALCFNLCLMSLSSSRVSYWLTHARALHSASVTPLHPPSFAFSPFPFPSGSPSTHNNVFPCGGLSWRRRVPMLVSNSHSSNDAARSGGCQRQAGCAPPTARSCLRRRRRRGHPCGSSSGGGSSSASWNTLQGSGAALLLPSTRGHRLRLSRSLALLWRRRRRGVEGTNDSAARESLEAHLEQGKKGQHRSATAG